MHDHIYRYIYISSNLANRNPTTTTTTITNLHFPRTSPPKPTRPIPHIPFSFSPSLENPPTRAYHISHPFPSLPFPPLRFLLPPSSRPIITHPFLPSYHPHHPHSFLLSPFIAFSQRGGREAGSSIIFFFFFFFFFFFAFYELRLKSTCTDLWRREGEVGEGRRSEGKVCRFGFLEFG